MGMKIEAKEIYAILLVFFLALGFWQFPAKDTLPDFTPAMVIQRLPAMSSPQPAHLVAAAAAEGICASILGQDAYSPKTIEQFLLIFPPILLSLSSLFLYLALRQLDFRRSASAFGALLFSLSLAAMQFLPGVYGSWQLAALSLSLFIFHFSYYVSKGKPLLLAPALLFAALAGYLNPAFGVAGIALAMAFAIQSYLKGERKIAHFAIVFLAFAAASFLSPERGQLSFSVQNIQSLFSLAPFLLAAASLSAVLFFNSSAQIAHLLLFIFGVLVSAISPLAGAMLLALPAAGGISQAASDKLSSKKAKLACAYFLAFFAIFGLASPVAGELRAAVIAFLISFLSPLMLHFYGYNSRQAFASLGIALLVLSVSFAVFYQMPPQRQFYPTYSDRDLSLALSQLSGKGVQKLALIGSQDAARFYVPSAGLESQTALSDYLSSGKNLSASGTYLLLSLSSLDEQAVVPGGGYETYFFYANFTSNGRNFAQFVSPSSGTILVRELDSNGGFALRDAQLIDPAGRPYGTISLSRMLLLKPGSPFHSEQNRLVAIDEGAQVPYFMKIYSGKADELALVSEQGKVTVFRVK